MGNVRRGKLRCMKCHEKNWRKDDRSWNNVVLVRGTANGAVLKCNTCGNQYYSQSRAARDLRDGTDWY
jgi:hypothetical protein